MSCALRSDVLWRWIHAGPRRVCVLSAHRQVPVRKLLSGDGDDSAETEQGCVPRGQPVASSAELMSRLWMSPQSDSQGNSHYTLKAETHGSESGHPCPDALRSCLSAWVRFQLDYSELSPPVGNRVALFVRHLLCWTAEPHGGRDSPLVSPSALGRRLRRAWRTGQGPCTCSEGASLDTLLKV